MATEPRPRGKGRWQVQAYLGRDPVTGSRRTVSRTITGTITEARKASARLQAEVDAGKIRPGDDLTLGQLFTTWIADEGPGWSPTTLAGTQLVARLHLGTLAERKLNQLRPLDISQHITALRAAGRGEPTLHKVRSRIVAALSYAVRMDLLATNPATRVKPPELGETSAQAATAAHVATVLGLLEQDPEMYAFVRLTSVAGARRGEVCALRWADLQDGAITWVRGVVDGGPDHGLVVKRLKTKKPKRTALDATTLEVLARWQIAKTADDLVHGYESPWVFPGVKDRDQPVRPDLMTKRWRRLRDAAEVPSTLRIHDLRHGMATDGMARGFSPVEVAGRLGHARTSTTTNLYGHHAPAGDQALADALGQALDEALQQD